MILSLVGTGATKKSSTPSILGTAVVIQLIITESLTVCGVAHIAPDVNVQRTRLLFVALFRTKLAPVPEATLFTNHWYCGLLPPLVDVAIKFNVVEGHPAYVIETDGATAANTETMIISDATHPAALVPVTVYVVVATGAAVTVATLVAFKPFVGDHWYEVAPFADNEMEEPLQILVSFCAMVTEGDGVNVTDAVTVSEHPLEVPITMYRYVAAAVGFAITDDPLVVFRPFPDQL